MLRGITAALVFSASAAAPAAAEVHTATWLGGNGGWFDASRWSTGVTPFNTATDQYDVIIDGGNPVSSSVLLGDSITVNSLALDGGLTIDAFDSFTALNGITLNNGGITMRADADVRVGLNGTITGSGGIFSYFGFNGGTVAADGGSLTLGSGLTVGATSAPDASNMTIGGN